MNMNIDNPGAGAVAESDTQHIIEFPRGIPGFESSRRFALLSPQKEDGQPSSHFILQSLDDDEAVFSIADPALLGFSYEIQLSDEECELLQLDSVSDAAIVVIVSEDENSKEVRANLQAPLVFNLKSLRGIQHVFARLSYKIVEESQG